MNVAELNKKFNRIGTKVRVVETNALRNPFRLDVFPEGKKEIFEIRHAVPVQAIVRDIRPANRHLLLQVSALGTSELFLCGHDERHYFAAGVPPNSKDVFDAMVKLQPPQIQEAAAKLPKAERWSRHNEAFKRQGEWFFVLAPGMVVDKRDILYNEPLRRGASKPHMVAEVFRTGGTAVMFHPQHASNGINHADFEALPEDVRRRPGWRGMQRDAMVYARGAVRHPDHATLTLKQWHRVFMNQEVGTRNLAFLD